jgi:hypothetical protein
VYGHAAKHDPLGLAQQLPAPLQHCPQRAMPRRYTATSVGQQPKTIVQALQQLVRSQRADPGGRQLQCQRDAVQLPADRGDLGGVVRVEGKARSHRRGTGHEQLYRTERPNILGGNGSRTRDGQRRDIPHHFAGQSERHLTGRQDAQPGCGFQQRGGQRRDGLDDTFAIVEHKCNVLAAQVPRQPAGVTAPFVADSERARDDVDDELFRRALRCVTMPVKTTKLHQPRVRQLPRGLQREPRLAHTTRTGQRD